MKFIIVPNNQRTPDEGLDTAYLHVDNWNDYSFVTMFYLTVFDEFGKKYGLGNVKIGFKGQVTEVSTYSKLEKYSNKLPEGFFSLSASSSYYKTIQKELSKECGDSLLKGLKDVVYLPELLDSFQGESVFGTSLMRSTSLSTIKGQFTRIINGLVELTKFDFSFKRPANDKFSELELRFKVSPNSTPRSNIHAIIGRNGIGKTTLLNNMISSVIEGQGDTLGWFFDNDNIFPDTKIESSYFSSIVSVSFSIFDPFEPPKERSDPSKGACYYYLGLKKANPKKEESSLKDIEQLRTECVASLKACFIEKDKKKQWLKAVKTLESDVNFSDMELSELTMYKEDDFEQAALFRLSKMSSGHAIVLLTITKLVDKVEEKTLVLIDEPESHLHPPLLSAFTRALSELLLSRNGVAIVATHSPVILQEIPKKCAWKVTRYGKESTIARPTIETFGENVGVLTREVFGLEVEKSGFLTTLKKSVDKGGDFDEILEEYEAQIGYEGQILLRTLIASRDKIIGPTNE